MIEQLTAGYKVEIEEEENEEEINKEAINKEVDDKINAFFERQKKICLKE